jgi:hypothetical protein
MKEAILAIAESERRKDVRERYCLMKKTEMTVKGMVSEIIKEKGVLRVKFFTHSANKELSPKV